MAHIKTISCPNSRAHLLEQLANYVKGRNEVGLRCSESSVMWDALEEFLKQHGDVKEPEVEQPDTLEINGLEFTPEQAAAREAVMRRITGELSGPPPDAPPVRSEAEWGS